MKITYLDWGFQTTKYIDKLQYLMLMLYTNFFTKYMFVINDL